MIIPSLRLLGSACLLLVSGLLRAAETEGPWRLGSALDLPEWAELGLEHRIRYESLGNQFRTGKPGSDQALALRSSLLGQIKTEPVGLLAEVMDSRQYLSDSGSPIDNTQVNALEVLQAHVRWDAGPLFTGGKQRFQLGRETLDLGNRRLVARNAYRNTLNAFTGADWLWTSDSGGSIRSFAFLPVRRLPEDAHSLLDHRISADTQSFGQHFYGVYATSRGLAVDA
ncbi:MAG: alginate export family protein, partial [Verrucomicrobiota bacterium]